MQGLSDSDLLIIQNPLLNWYPLCFLLPEFYVQLNYYEWSATPRSLPYWTLWLAPWQFKKTISGFRGFSLTERWKIIGFSHPNPHHAQWKLTMRKWGQFTFSVFSVWLGCDESECWHYFGAKLVDRGATVNLDCCVPVSGGCVLLLGLATLLALVSPVCTLPWGCHVFVGSLLGSLGWSGFRWLPLGFGLGCLFWGSPFSYPRLSLVCCGAVYAWWGPGA